MQSVKMFGDFYLMVLSTWNVEYALQEQSTNTIYSPYCRHLRNLIMLSGFPKSIPISYRSYNCSATRWPDKRCLSHGMCLYQVIMTLHFLNDVVNDFKST